MPSCMTTRLVNCYNRSSFLFCWFKPMQKIFFSKGHVCSKRVRHLEQQLFFVFRKNSTYQRGNYIQICHLILLALLKASLFFNKNVISRFVHMTLRSLVIPSKKKRKKRMISIKDEGRMSIKKKIGVRIYINNSLLNVSNI